MKSNSRSFATSPAWAMAMLLMTAFAVHGADYMKGLDEKHPMIADKKTGEIRILAELQPDAFKGGWFTSTPATMPSSGKAARRLQKHS